MEEEHCKKTKVTFLFNFFFKLISYSLSGRKCFIMFFFSGILRMKSNPECIFFKRFVEEIENNTHLNDNTEQEEEDYCEAGEEASDLRI